MPYSNFRLKMLSCAAVLAFPLLIGASQTRADYGYFNETYFSPQDPSADFQHSLRWNAKKEGIFQFTFTMNVGEKAANYTSSGGTFSWTWTGEFLDGLTQSELFTVKVPKGYIDPTEEMKITIAMRYRLNASKSWSRFATCTIYVGLATDPTAFSDTRLPPDYNQLTYIYHFGSSSYLQKKMKETISLYGWDHEASLIDGHLPMDFYFVGSDPLGEAFEVTGSDEQLRIYGSRISDFNVSSSYLVNEASVSYLSFPLVREYDEETNETRYALKDTFYVSQDGRDFADYARKTDDMVETKNIYLPTVKDYGSEYYEIHLHIDAWGYFETATFDGVMEIWKSRNFFGGKSVSDFYIAEGSL